MLISTLSGLLLGFAAGARSLIPPTAIYDGGFDDSKSDIPIRIATGGAGQSGLVKALADAFIKESVDNGAAPFRIAWVVSDTTFTIKNLQLGEADLGITFSFAAEKIAADQGIIDKDFQYLYRDHFLIVGPPENPANVHNSSDALTILAKIFESAEKNSATTKIPTRFLSRYDKSATNIKESELWLGVGQVPWGLAYSTWYHQYIAFPIQALTTAAELKEYTLTDRGTLLSLPRDVAKRITTYKAASDNLDDILLNPAKLLVGKKAQNETMAYKFSDWATSKNGQKVIIDFKKNGEQLYSGAPSKKERERVPVEFMVQQAMSGHVNNGWLNN